MNISQSENITDQQYDNLRLSLNDTAQYIDPPVQLQYLYTNHIASNDSDMVNAPINSSVSLSTPWTTPSVMALKKNGQERNKQVKKISGLEWESNLHSHISGRFTPSQIMITDLIIT